MAKVTSKRQVTIPKEIADRYGIREGDELDFEPAGEVIRVSMGGKAPQPNSIVERLRLFDAATNRQRLRDEALMLERSRHDTGRGWTREELYRRASTD